MSLLKSFLCSLCLLGCVLQSSGQNLVRNWSFEEKSDCPSVEEDIDKLLNWRNPSDASPDFHHECTPSFSRKARTGDGFGGIFVISGITNDIPAYNNYREYLTNSLSRGLESGRPYCLSFYVRNYPLAEASPIGAYLSQDSSFFTPTEIDSLSVIPQVEYTGPPIPDDSNWFRIGGIYTASGGESLLTIGNFRGDSNTVVDDTSNGADAYYDLDDVSLIPTRPQGLPQNGDTLTCRGDSVRLSTVLDDTIADYSWSPSQGLSDSTASGPMASPDSTTTYTVTKRTCCDTTTEQVTVTVLDTPSVGLKLDSCAMLSDSILLDTSYASDSTSPQWSPPQGLSDASSFSTLAAPSSKRQYVLTVTDTTNGCTAQDRVTVDPLGLSLSDTTICEGDSSRPASGGDASLSYEWSPSTGLSDSTLPTPLSSPDSSINYTVTEKSACDTNISQVKITVKDTPTVHLEHEACAQVSDTIALTPQVPSGISVHWDPSTGLSDSSSASVLAFPDSTRSYTLTVTDTGSGCSKADSVRIEPVRMALSDTALCKGSSLRIDGRPHPDVEEDWDPTASISDPQSASPVLSPDTSRTFTLQRTSPCDTTTHSMTVTVHERPEAEAGEDRSVRKGERVRIGPTAQADVNYSWTPTDALTAPDTTPTEASPKRTTVYVLEAENESTGCIKRDSIRIEVEEWELFIPNVFAPSSKGVQDNKVFRVLGGPFQAYQLQVFNRWGELVFESEDPQKAWDGTHRGGPVEAGTYVYRFRARLPNGREIEREGTVTLLR